MLSDFRYTGGTSASMAEEIKAQARAGFTTGLLHVPAAHLRTTRPFNERIRACVRAGFADLVDPEAPVRARILLIRQPRIFATEPERPLGIRADHTVVVVNQGPQDALGDEIYYDLGEVAARVHALFGEDVEWAPIGPLVRETVLTVDPGFPLSPAEWHNIIDVDHWSVDRSTFVGEHPVIGRHSRPDWKKWPGSADELRAVYPDREDMPVRILGGSEVAEKVLGGRPRNWTVHQFNTVEPRQFLRSIDFFVYFHNPAWVEAFGRTILEALSSGAPAILPRHFERVFGDAALYCQPEEVQGLVERLHADADAYRAQSELGQRRVRERFGYESHAIRLAERIGSPRGEPEAPERVARRSRKRMLFLSSNGAGLGHLTRLMAVGNRLPSRYQVVIGTQSQAVPLVNREGFLTEYVPSRRYQGSESREWNGYLQLRLEELIAAYDPALVLVDGTVPYWGLVRVMEAHPDRQFVWLRRPMWRAGEGGEWLRRGLSYDAVIEPGEFASPVDEGLTVGRGDAVPVEPIVYLDEKDLLDRAEACAALDLDPERPAALIQLGAGNINDVTSDVGVVAERLLREPGLQVALAQSPIATSEIEPPPGLRILNEFPMSRFYRAFDLVVSAAGYNSYHELLRFGVPSLLIPNEHTELDDQVARARFAADAGVALCLEAIDADSADRCLSQLLDPQVREGMRERCAALAPGNGAQRVADTLVGLLEGASKPAPGAARPEGGSAASMRESA